jgi:hypothetical protein
MKKVLLPFFALAIQFAGYSQYGHRIHEVNASSFEQFNDGLITDVVLSGGLPVYASAGAATLPATTAGSQFTRSRFNTSSFAGAQLAGRYYFLFSNGAEWQNRLNSIVERGTAGYAMSGAVYNSNSAGDVLLMNVGTNGTPTATGLRRIDLGGFDEAFCTRRSLNNTARYYTCGSSIAPNSTTGSSQVFLMKHNEDGSTIDWVRKFNVPCGNSNTSPAEAVAVLDDGQTGNVILVGNIRSTSTAAPACQQAFIAKFSAAGALIWFRILTSTGLSNISLQNIRPTNTPQEYAIVGSAVSSSLAGRRQVLFLRVNTSGANPVNSPGTPRLIRSNGPTPNYPVQNQEGFDVVTRVNAAGSLSYYIAGSTQLTSSSKDGLLIRLNNTTAPVFLRHYTGSGNESLFAIDMVQNTASGQGLAAFGVFGSIATLATPAINKSWLAKTYFNLVSGCNEVIDSPLSTNPPVTYTAFIPTITNTFTSGTLTGQFGTTLQKTICWNTTITGGSNARLAEEETAGAFNAIESISVFPNPVSSNDLNFRLISANNQTVRVQLCDVAGRLHSDNSQEFTSGENTGTISVRDLPKGIYILRLISSDGAAKNIRFVKD